MESVKKALSLKKELDSLRPLKKEIEQRVMQKLRLDWNYHSNHLEGNTLSYGETKALILFGITAQGKPLRDHIEITGHNQAILWVLDVVKGDRNLSETFIRQLHTLLLKEPYQVDAITPEGLPTKKWVKVGEYKTTPNHVETKTGEIFYFATPEETPAKMYDLMEWYSSEKVKSEMNPILLAAKFHYDFIRIHPFDDGNGRTVRILMNFILMKFGFPPIIIKTEDKPNYLSVLEQADARNIEPFIEYIATNLVSSLEIMIKAAKGEPFEESDDIDKELTLLEKRLEGLSKPIEIFKSKEVIADTIKNSVRPLFNAANANFQKFLRFYTDFSIRIFHNGYGIEVPNQEIILLEKLTNQLNNSTERITLDFQFKTFKYQDFREFDYDIRIEILFNLSTYIIKTFDTQLVKNYSEKLTKDELKTMLQVEQKNHSTFIETKIKEYETKKPSE